MTTKQENQKNKSKFDALNHSQRAVLGRALYIRNARITPFAASRIVEVR